MEVVNAPNYAEWFESSERFYCKVTVLRLDGEAQVISGCSFSYALIGKYPLFFKGLYQVKDFFFVKEILKVEVLKSRPH